MMINLPYYFKLKEGLLNSTDVLSVNDHKCPVLGEELASVKYKPSANPKDAFGDKKAPLHLFPDTALIEASIVMRDGAEKYGAYNWRENAVQAHVYVSAVRRHLAQWWNGEDNDPESKSNVNHLASALAGLAIMLDAINVGNLIDDRPHRADISKVLKEKERKE